MLRRFSLLALLCVTACGGQIDSTATEKPLPPSGAAATPPTTTPPSSSSGGSSGSSSTSSSGGGPGRACAGDVIPFEIDFENSFKEAFTVSGPSAFTIEYEKPIAGSMSLKVQPNKSSYLSRKYDGVCAAALAFTFRPDADFVASGGNLARINAGSRRFYLVVGHSQVTLSQEIATTGALGMEGGAPFAKIAPELTSRIRLEVDLSNGVVVADVDGNTNKVPFRPTPEPLASPAAITSVEIGSVPGIDSNPKGFYWIDDVTIR